MFEPWNNVSKAEPFQELQAEEIKNVYQKVDRAWLKFHYKLSIILVAFSFIVACVLSTVIVHSELLTTTVERFVWKFMIVPTGLNLMFLTLSTVAMRSKKIDQDSKIYVISLSLVGICLVLFTVHNAFISTYFIFTVAIMLTAIYANYRLTLITAMTSIVSMVSSELWIKWDLDKLTIYESVERFSEFMIAIAILLAVSSICMVIIRYERMKNKASIEMTIERRILQRRLQIDEMTGTFNRIALGNALKDAESDLSNDRHILAIIDIDHFKQINDRFGHHIGDFCLIEFAKVLKNVGNRGICFRYGGDEFCIVFRGLELQEVVDICTEIREAVLAIEILEEPLVKLTTSIGIAELTKHIDVEQLFIRADQALYEAKSVRNKVCVYKKKRRRLKNIQTKTANKIG